MAVETFLIDLTWDVSDLFRKMMRVLRASSSYKIFPVTWNPGSVSFFIYGIVAIRRWLSGFEIVGNGK